MTQNNLNVACATVQGGGHGGELRGSKSHQKFNYVNGEVEWLEQWEAGRAKTKNT